MGVDSMDRSIHDAGSVAVLRLGLATTPGLARGFAFTVAMAIAASIGRLTVPVLIQLIIDNGLASEEGYRAGYVTTMCLVALAVVVTIILLHRAAYIRLLENAEAGLRDLRVKAFDHIHGLSIAEHTEAKRGELTARVTSDVEQLAMFVRWGAVNWVVSSTMIVGTLAVMLWYSWMLTLIVVLVYSPTAWFARWVQRRQLAAYAKLRDRVSGTITGVSEVVMGAAVIRAYNHRPTVRRQMHELADRQYHSQMSAQKYFSLYIPITDVIGGLCLAAVFGVGVWLGPDQGLTGGQLIAFLFLVNLLLNPITAITEVLDTTQTTIASWRRVLAVFEMPKELVDPAPGRPIPGGPLAVDVDDVRFSYRTGPEVLHGISAHIPAGARVAVVGETGSGKSTFAQLLARLSEPTDGSVAVGGVDLTAASGPDRRRSVRIVPQDGFLFDATIAKNVNYGRSDIEPRLDDRGSLGKAERVATREAFDALDLGWWLDRMPDGIDTPVGERGEHLSVGERQLVALARAQLADPGLLILDEATSAVDPETEQALARALERLSEGRTTVSIAHRLSTAEAADMVLVFDDGHIVEQGAHDELVAHGGVYAGLYESWLGNTRTNSR